ncbi:hypothetical protein CSC71_05765 [Pseudoxanthomonas sangjuensis]|nr:hypothetical protein CSC71_05765 [Pseudoxanthomonas sangjuensis]
MANGWTPERRARQSEAIKRWKPWEKTRGPVTEEGKRRSSRNAWKGGERPILREWAQMLREQERQRREAW